MNAPHISRRALMTAALGTTAFFGPWKHTRVWAQGAAKPIKMGFTCDASGQYAVNGQDEMLGMRLALDEFNARGGVLGRKIEWITADTETNPSTGTRIAERFISQDQCAFLLGACHSGVANAITQVANKTGTIFMNTNSSASSEAGENCSRNKFVWDGNGTNFSKASVKNAVDRIGKKWVQLTNDYVWGHVTAAATKTMVEAAGGRVVENLLVPSNTRDFTSYLLKIQQTRPDVVAITISGDDIKVLRQQITELKLDNATAWLNNQQDWPDIFAIPETLFGVFGTTWYHKLQLPGVEDFVKRWRAAYPKYAISVPGNVSYNGYMAMRELLLAIERAGSTNNAKVIRALEGHKMSALDRMQHFDAYIDPVTHQVQQTVYLARRNAKPSDPTDHYEILSQAKPQDVLDDEAPLKCKMTPFEKLPVYEL